MKKKFLFLSIATILLSFSSCKKAYNCLCYDTTASGNIPAFNGPVDAISLNAATSQIQKEYPGTICSCH